ncbi:MAG: nicotinamide mononucleotide deamidase PncC [Saliniramus fredricksonii]|uniref:Nicotinamide mononucleotide deamidase PncC n=1 Tax=Saliniramus fredricksonii TaxID=1653334 RepID=A0A0N8KEF4_9HYPH|nr:CinA family protein [Saliniramus fredricksonii]KPQ11186.1 MAG: nicotinamide mononucleotide deamidase PncC [Saliniramus fredricksonii]SCC81716.1 nicotinamide-nucleotide amidase [Saliniramus fredricksonii]
MIFTEERETRAANLLEVFAARGLMIATAESCTGGLIAGLLTEIAGSSRVVERGFVSYSNAAKNELLGVPTETIEAHGAVSETVVRAMAEGALAQSRAHVAIAVSGVAGPGGGTVAKPVGLVHLACARQRGATVHLERRYGDRGRGEIRLMTIDDALGLLEAAIAEA